MLYTPDAHIPITQVSVDNGVIYLEFKKSRENVRETMTLDQFLFLLCEKINGFSVQKFDGEYYRFN